MKCIYFVMFSLSRSLARSVCLLLFLCFSPALFLSLSLSHIFNARSAIAKQNFISNFLSSPFDFLSNFNFSRCLPGPYLFSIVYHLYKVTCSQSGYQLNFCTCKLYQTLFLTELFISSNFTFKKIPMLAVKKKKKK